MNVAPVLAPAAGLVGAWCTRRAWIRHPRPPVTHSPSRPGVVTSIGRAVQSRLRFLDGLPARALGLVVVASAVLLPIDPALCGLVVAGTFLAAATRRVATRRRQRLRLLEELPATIEVLRMAVASGLTLTEAIEVVAQEIHDAAGELFGQVAHRHGRGESLADALVSVGARVGEPAEAVLALLATTHRSGAAVGDALGRMATRQRAALRRAAEARARRLPVALLLPLICCVLPSFALLTIVPVLVTGVTRLRIT
jgi:tight adherence protein C